MATDDIRHLGGYDVLVQPGRTRKLIISLAGIGDPEQGKMAFEWRRTIERHLGKHHALFVKDLQRSYFNNEDGFDDLVALIRGYQQAHDIAHTVIVGLSMGGYGAFLLGRQVPVQQVVALSPRAGLKTEAVAFDKRLPRLMAALPAVIRHPDAVALANGGPPTLVLFTLDSREDTLHASAFAGLPNVQLWATHGEHNLGLELQRQKALGRFFTGLMRKDLDLEDLGFARPVAEDFARARAFVPGAAPWVSCLGRVPAYAAPPAGREAGARSQRAGGAPPPAPPAGPAAAWRRALRVGDFPLLHPQHQVVVVFSAKSACSAVTIWLLHQLGLAGEARAYSDWPHDYRIQRLYKSAADVAARATLRPDEVKLLRVVRDPLQRAVSSFRHALGTLYAREAIREKLDIDIAVQGLSFERFIDFLAREDLDTCDPHHRRQCQPIERLRAPDMVINASRQDLFAGLNAFEALAGMPRTDFFALRWIHDLQATRQAPAAADLADPYRAVLTVDQARRGPWPSGLLTPEARERLLALYAEDVGLYGAL